MSSTNHYENLIRDDIVIGAAAIGVAIGLSTTSVFQRFHRGSLPGACKMGGRIAMSRSAYLAGPLGGQAFIVERDDNLDDGRIVRAGEVVLFSRGAPVAILRDAAVLVDMKREASRCLTARPGQQ